jgi:anti-anti-sigma regulatory factor
LSLTVDRTETHWLLLMEGDFNMTSSAALQGALLEGLASGTELQLDLERVGDIDITFLQLLWSAERDAQRAGSGFVSRVSPTAAAVARAAGFERFPGERAQPEAAEG